MKRIAFHCLVGLSLISFNCLAQVEFTVKGNVINGEDQTLLPGATVFLANTSKGIQTDSEGRFELVRIPAGRFKLVISFIGFETIFIDIISQDQKTYKIILKPSPQNLQEVVIRSKMIGYSQRNEDLKTFKEYFIGLSDNANQCVIKNPDVLRFSNKNSLFSAKADSILIIENEGLGYRLKFLLEEFVFDRLEKKVVYKGQVVYESILPKDDSQNKQWAANRLKAYHGSELHFMRSLFQRRLMEEGFYVKLFESDQKGVFRNKPVTDITVKARSDVFRNRFSIRTITNYSRILDSTRAVMNESVLSFNGRLDVTYIHELESSSYSFSRGNRKTGYKILQTSSISLYNKTLLIEPSGLILSEEHLPTKGYWSWELVSESLPVDYDPDSDVKIVGNPY